MQTTRQISGGQVERGGNLLIWQGGKLPAEASVLEAAVEEINLLPEFEEFLRDSKQVGQCVPGREGLLG